uniref:Ferredoxin n=1 Tax=Eubacterium plexicaudatum ASF492 TaxID=1235802 RepID=N2AUT3_9FIRM
MEKSKVYYTSFKANEHENLLQKLRRLMITAGMKEIDFADKYAAIKIHFGEYGNLAFLRPNYAKVMADLVKECGGKPFLTDCNTLYVGSRKNALDHIETAYLNGFNPYATGCHVLIGDGLKGTDETLVPIHGEYVKEAKIGTAIMDADVFLTLTHFKGHEMTGFGGALKNIGMGCGSRGGKMEMHNDGKPYVEDPDGCIGCGSCQRICAHGAPIMENKKVHIDHEKCVGCGRCLAVCPKDVIQPSSSSSVKSLNCKMAEYSLAVCKGRPHFHVSLICDVSPNCDCHAENDIPIIPDVGMFASFDPVALDVACADAVNKMPVIEGSILSDNLKEDANHGEGHDHFHMTHPDTEWKSCIEHAVKIGLGHDQYELIGI